MPQPKSVRVDTAGSTLPSGAYARRIGPFSGTMMVVGGIIGSGIFLNPAVVAERARTVELGARRPVAGGGYVYLRDAYGRLPAFLYAWTLLLVIATGAIAAVAVTFASYTASLAGFGPAARLPLAVGAILLLSAVNYVGVKPGAITQNVLTVLKLSALAILIVAGLTLAAAPLPSEQLGPVAPAGSCLRWAPPWSRSCLPLVAGNRRISWRRN